MEGLEMQAVTPLDAYYFERYILDVAIATLEKGISASKVDTYQFLSPVDAWGFPKYPGRTAILPPDVDLVTELKAFIQANRRYLLEADSWLGTWIHPASRYYYLDVTMSCEGLEEARKKAMERGERGGRKIIALYNSLREETVYL
jgi:hypothetical protein